MDWLSWLFPRRCVGCGCLGAYICPDCLNRFQPLTELWCPVCRKKSYGGYTHPNCAAKYDIDGLISAYSYHGIAKRIITKFKYKFVSDLAGTLTELLVSEIKHPLLFTQSWTLVPIPLHLHRQRWRGFNQAQVLAKCLSQEWHMNISHTLLIRSRNTRPQMSLSAAARRQNLKQAFSLSPGLSVPNSVLIVDDVATSCATLRESAYVLKRAGARNVWGLTLAQAIPHKST